MIVYLLIVLLLLSNSFAMDVNLHMDLKLMVIVFYVLLIL